MTKHTILCSQISAVAAVRIRWSIPVEELAVAVDIEDLILRRISTRWASLVAHNEAVISHCFAQ